MQQDIYLKSTTEWLNINLFSLDLNPIEMMWFDLKQTVNG